MPALRYVRKHFAHAKVKFFKEFSAFYDRLTGLESTELRFMCDAVHSLVLRPARWVKETVSRNFLLLVFS